VSRRADLVAVMLERAEALGLFATVERWRDTGAEPFTLAECPALNIKDGSCSVKHQVSEDEHALDVKYDIVTLPGTPAAQVDQLMDALVGDIESDDGTWGDRADGSNLESHEVDTTSEGADPVVSAQLKYTVNYTTAKGQL
jgi:hypothetical protein